MWDFMFFANSCLLGVGLAMDAFSVSLANGLNEKSKMFGISSLFAVFQALMPMIGWVCVHTILQYFNFFENTIPWISLFLLCFLGVKMIVDGVKNNGCSDSKPVIGLGCLLVQAIATSIDALSVGFTIAGHDWIHALVSVLIIGALTFGICFAGVCIGRKFGTKISNKASIFGGIILILIGIEIFVTGVFF